MESRVERRRERLINRNPVTGAEIADLPILAAAEVRGLVETAHAAQREWAGGGLSRRIEALRRLRRILVERAERTAEVVRSETGKVFAEAMFEAVFACDYVAYIARAAPAALRARRVGTGWLTHRKGRVCYEPYGVVGAITPWNYPFALDMTSVTTAVAAGNAVVLKPSEHTPQTGLLVAELFAEATGLADLVQVATGDGRTGRALVESGVDKVAFTGSAATGREVMAAAAESLTPVVLELGGKDAMIVCDDADLERAARGAVWGAFFGAGEICMSVERVYVLASAYDDFVRAAVEEARRVSVGDESEAMIGSLIAPFQLEKVEDHVSEARARGARILLGGRRIEGPGYLYAPTVVVDVTQEMKVMREETFGPVLPIMRVSDDEEAIRMANDSEYGLDASVWSRDRERARGIASRLDVGSVLINDHLVNYVIPGLPFGGTRQSGFGRVHGLEGLREFTRPKSWLEDRIALGRELHWFVEGGSDKVVRALLQMRHARNPLHRLKGALALARAYFSR